MLISVNICLYNSTKYIQETLDSVFAQTYQDFEIIAIDDGSTDGTYEFIKERYNDPRLKLYRQENHGLSYTRNKCLEYSKGEYIAFLDHDDVWMPNKLKLQVDGITNRKTIPYIVFGNYEVLYETSTPSKFPKERIIFTDDLFETFLLSKCNVIVLSSAMVYAKAFEESIKFENYRIGEEFDVWLKIAYKHSQYVYVPEVICKWRIHGNNTTLKLPEESFTDGIQILQGWIPEMNNQVKSSMLNACIARVYLRYGHWLLDNNRSLEAKAMFINSLKNNYYDLHNYWALIKYWLKK